MFKNNQYNSLKKINKDQKGREASEIKFKSNKQPI